MPLPLPTPRALESVRLAYARAVLAKKRNPDDPRLAQQAELCRRDYAAAKLADHIQHVVATAPPLTDEQRDKLMMLLRGAPC